MAQQEPDDSTPSEYTKEILAWHAKRIAKFADDLLNDLVEIGADSALLTPFPLDSIERSAVAGLTALAPHVQNELVEGTVNAKSGIDILKAISGAEVTPGSGYQRTLYGAADKLSYNIHANVLTPAWRAAAGRRRPTKQLYQLKVTLGGIRPAIWRRIQVRDCTLDRLHEHIQSAMGWTNSHLHRFEVKGRHYGVPELLQGDFHEQNFRDATVTLLSTLLPHDGRRFRFHYEYDFGDSWNHGILFEGCPDLVEARNYPVCIEGERACPPEDVGGTWGYKSFLEAIGNRNNPDHESMLEWVGGRFDPEEFDAATATERMCKGVDPW